MKNSEKIIIIGGGMVGMSVAYQLIARGITNKITIIDKESELGMHTSGRNSGVLHAGIYYKPETIKAKICINGSLRLKEWISENNLKINNCGKVIVPTSIDLDQQLDLLLQRGLTNGAKCEIINDKDLYKLVPQANCPSGRALWSPQTSVVNPYSIVSTLKKKLLSFGVIIKTSERNWSVKPEINKVILSDGTSLHYDYFFNCAGLYADKIANQFNIGNNYILIPFKGNYWKLRKESNIKISTNLYPVPNLDLPFLGVHFTPSADESSLYIGPTATLAFGRENYSFFEGIQPLMSFENISILTNQYLLNKGRIREYFHRQSLLSFKQFFLKAAQNLVPLLSEKDIEFSNKVGIRPQLFNKNENKIEDDFLYLNTQSSMHVLNAISPAFTASFALGDLIIDKSNLA
tara:strand:- start:9505 stop:10719 length:1215 start_codon:yes stop_codon:yes gene_type:complete